MVIVSVVLVLVVVGVSLVVCIILVLISVSVILSSVLVILSISIRVIFGGNIGIVLFVGAISIILRCHVVVGISVLVVVCLIISSRFIG